MNLTQKIVRAMRAAPDLSYRELNSGNIKRVVVSINTSNCGEPLFLDIKVENCLAVPLKDDTYHEYDIAHTEHFVVWDSKARISGYRIPFDGLKGFDYANNEFCQLIQTLREMVRFSENDLRAATERRMQGIESFNKMMRGD